MSGQDVARVPEDREPHGSALVGTGTALVVYEPPRRGWKRTVAAVALVVLCAVPVTAGVGFLLASDRFSNALGAGGDQPDGNEHVGTEAWSALSDLGGTVDFSLSLSRPALDGAIAAAFDKIKTASRDAEDGERLQLDTLDVVPAGPDLRVVVRGRLENGLFGAELSARATLKPRLDRAGVRFTASAVETTLDKAGLKRPTLSPGEAAESAEPAVQAAYKRLNDAVAQIAAGAVLAAQIPGASFDKNKPLAAAFMFDAAGAHVIGRLQAQQPTSDDDLLTGSLGSAGLTLDQYRAAFRAAQDKSLAVAATSGAAAELTVSRAALSGMLAEAGDRSCAPLAVETEPLTLTGPVQLAPPPASPQCQRIAAACAARDLCAQAETCRDKVVEETVEETVKVPVYRNGCARREYICYGWGPYGCAWGQSVCVAPRRFTEFKDKTVQRVVERTEQADAPQCQGLRAMQADNPGLCDRLADKAPECGLVSNGSSVADCEARGAMLDRIRQKPTATATLRIVGRGRVQSCSRGTIAADLAGAKLATTISGKLDVLAEVTIRPDGRADTDSALRCTLEPAAALKGSAKLQSNRSDTVAIKASSRAGELALSGAAGAGTLTVALDKTVAASLFGGKSGVVYRCRVEGPAGASFAQWESRVGPALEDMVAKAGKLVAQTPAPEFEARLPRTKLLGRDAEAKLSDAGAVFLVR